MKALPVTHKATRSPLKMSGADLVANDRQIHKRFVDAEGPYAEGRKEAMDSIRTSEAMRAKEKEPNPNLPGMADTSGIDTTEAKKTVKKAATNLVVKTATGGKI